MTSSSEFLSWLEEEEKTTGNQLWNLSQEIWKHPEVKFEEFRAHDVLTDFLEKKGFKVEKSYLLPTAFKAQINLSDENSNNPRLGILCEYDALPVVGHSCGHNLIAELGVGAALALQNAFQHGKRNIPGKIVVFGTPAEESGGGKIEMLNKGAFCDLDAVLMAHPAFGHNSFAIPNTISSLAVDVSYYGRASHSAGKPWEGRNALDAAVACYVNVALLKQQLPPGWLINGFISKGGEATNVVPRETAMKFLLRTPYSPDCKSLEDRLKKCIYAAAEAHGCQADYVSHWDTHYQCLVQNESIGKRFQKHCEELGFQSLAERNIAGSTDFGNVSQVVPGLHPIYGLNTDIFPHMEEFGAVAGSIEAQGPTLKIAAALAATGADLLTDSELLSRVKQMHKEQMEKLKNNEKKDDR